MINIFNIRNVVIGIVTTGIAFLIKQNYSTSPTETFEQFETLYDVFASAPQFQWLDASEFPDNIRENALRFKEEFIEKLIRESNETREGLERYGRIQLRYPLPDDVNKVIFALDREVALLNPKPTPTYEELQSFMEGRPLDPKYAEWDEFIKKNKKS